jgi:exopolysaccharide biosynthesis polyprenyl glycosylphosphotransferase
MTLLAASVRDVAERQVSGGTRRVEGNLRPALRLVAGVDTLVVSIALLSARWLHDVLPGASIDHTGDSLVTTFTPVIALTWVWVLLARGGYSVRFFGAGLREYGTIILSSFLAAGVLGFYCYLTKVDLSRGFVSLSFVLGTVGLVLNRWAARNVLYALRRRDRLVRRVVVVGGDSGIDEVLSVLERDRHIGFRAVGVCSTDRAPTEGVESWLKAGGADIRRTCLENRADTVLVARGAYNSSEELRRVSWDLEGTDISLVVVPSLIDVAGPRIHFSPVAGLPLIHLEEPHAGRARGLVKRVLDVVGSLVALLLLGPVLVGVALAIKLEGAGPLVFRQRRVGLHGEVFSCLKFRSMRPDSAELEAGLRVEQGHEGALWKMQDDPRVTTVGRIIRRYSLDELPQLFNVLRGEMSLVGPRPQQEWEVALYSEMAQRRLLVRPGMTGLWQVSGRSQLPFDEAVRLDLYYVDNWSVLADVEILAKTVRAVVRPSGIH